MLAVAIGLVQLLLWFPVNRAHSQLDQVGLYALEEFDDGLVLIAGRSVQVMRGVSFLNDIRLRNATQNTTASHDNHTQKSIRLTSSA